MIGASVGMEPYVPAAAALSEKECDQTFMRSCAFRSARIALFSVPPDFEIDVEGGTVARQAASG